MFRRLQSERRNAETLWPHTPEQFIALWNQIVVELQLQPLNPCRYALRHGGASEDILSRRRLLVDVKRRGRWVSDSSLRRYGKETRLLSELTKVHPDVLAYGDRILGLLPSLFLEAAPVPAPPRPEA